MFWQQWYIYIITSLPCTHNWAHYVLVPKQRTGWFFMYHILEYIIITSFLARFTIMWSNYKLYWVTCLVKQGTKMLLKALPLHGNAYVVEFSMFNCASTALHTVYSFENSTTVTVSRSKVQLKSGAITHYLVHHMLWCCTECQISHD